MPVKFDSSRSGGTVGSISVATRPLAIANGGAITSMATFTVAGWIWLDTTSNASVADWLWGEADGSTNCVVLQHYNGSLWFRVRNAAGTETTRNTSARCVTPHRWQHVVMTYTASSNTLTFVVDGVSQSVSSATPTGNARTGTQWQFGTVNGAGSAEHSTGALHKFRFWNRALSEAEAQSEYAGTPVTSGLVVSFDFDANDDGVLAAGGTATGITNNSSVVNLYRPVIQSTTALPTLGDLWSGVYLPDGIEGPTGGNAKAWRESRGLGGTIDQAQGGTATNAPLVDSEPLRCLSADLEWTSSIAVRNWGLSTTAGSSAYDGPTFDRQNFTMFAVVASHGRYTSSAANARWIEIGFSNVFILGMNAATNALAYYNGSSWVDTDILCPSTPFFVAISSSSAGVNITVEEFTETDSAMSSGIVGTTGTNVANNILDILRTGNASGSVYAFGFRSKSSTAAELAEIQRQVKIVLGLPTERPLAVVTAYGDSRGVVYSTRHRTYVGRLAKTWARRRVRVYNLAMPGRSIAGAVTALAEINHANIVASAANRVLLVNIGGNETAWRTSSDVSGDGASAAATLKSGVVDAATNYRVKVVQTLIPNGSSGTGSQNETAAKVIWYYNEAIRNWASDTIRIADVADVGVLVPAAQSRANDITKSEPTSTNTQIQAVTGGTMYETASSAVHLHLSSLGFESGYPATDAAITPVLVDMTTVRRRRPRAAL